MISHLVNALLDWNLLDALQSQLLEHAELSIISWLHCGQIKALRNISGESHAGGEGGGGGVGVDEVVQITTRS